VKKKLQKKLQLKTETLFYLGRVSGGSAGPTCADTCGEPETGGWYATNALACPTGGGCGSTFPGCTVTDPTLCNC
jgi:hypothetical protein